MQVALDLTGADATLSFDRAFRADVSAYVADVSASAASLASLEIGPILQGLFDLLRNWRIECPSDLVFLIKALVTIEGVGAALDPAFDFFGHVRPRLERLVKQQYRPKAIRRRMIRAAGGYVDLIEELPTDLRALLTLFRRQDFAFSLRHEGLDRLSTTAGRASRTIAYGLLVAAIIMGSAVLILAERGDDKFGLLSALGFVRIFSTAFVVGVLGLWTLQTREAPRHQPGRREDEDRPAARSDSCARTWTVTPASRRPAKIPTAKQRVATRFACNSARFSGFEPAPYSDGNPRAKTHMQMIARNAKLDSRTDRRGRSFDCQATMNATTHCNM
jgi:hypothetical protein